MTSGIRPSAPALACAATACAAAWLMKALLPTPGRANTSDAIGTRWSHASSYTLLRYSSKVRCTRLCASFTPPHAAAPPPNPIEFSLVVGGSSAVAVLNETG